MGMPTSLFVTVSASQRPDVRNLALSVARVWGAVDGLNPFIPWECCLNGGGGCSARGLPCVYPTTLGLLPFSAPSFSGDCFVYRAKSCSSGRTAVVRPGPGWRGSHPGPGWLSWDPSAF